ncbi:MAG: hypothetical protein ACLPKE_17640 [Streptosporangiaceae bacterium]
MRAKIEHAVTRGTFSLDGQTFDVANNGWVVGDGTECVVLGPPGPDRPGRLMDL